jgi:CelD/BcsL family acetyltransferase involved in cellulose biosynthesis
MEISLLHTDDEKLWEQLVLDSPIGMFYHSIKWVHFLSKFTKTIPLHLVAKQKGQIVGILPAFLKKGKWGNVLNSSPFYGSHGGVILSADGNGAKIKKQLLHAFKETASSQNCIASTIISSPFDTDRESYERCLESQQLDQRIGQIVCLPDDNLEETLMKCFDSRRRRSIRKAIKSGIKVFSSSNQEHLLELYHIHVSNMRDLGGIPKPLRFFEQVREYFLLDKEWKLWLAELNGTIVAGLLVFYYKNIVEYYTPVVNHEYRSMQPLSLVIFKAMMEAMKQGYRYWNFGGTWINQEGVYRFKKLWGAEDYPYYYYVNIYDSIAPLSTLSKEEILQEYPWFYVFPFEKVFQSG